MPEQIHLLISEPEWGDPSKVMQVLKQRVARRLLRRKRTVSGQGELFATAVDHFWQPIGRPSSMGDAFLR